MLTQKLMAQDVLEEVKGALAQAGISEIDFLREYRFDHHLLGNLRQGASIRTGTVARVYECLIDIDRDWKFKHELRDEVIVRAKAFRFIRDGSGSDGLQQAVFALERWPRRG